MPKQLTITDLNNLAETILIGIDKRNFATKDDVKKIVNDALHVQLADFNEYIIKPQFEEMASKIDLKDVETRLSNKIDNQSQEFVKRKDLQKLYA
jgi:hypothetical protein